MALLFSKKVNFTSKIGYTMKQLYLGKFKFKRTADIFISNYLAVRVKNK